MRSFQLFATPEGWTELEAAEDEAALHAQWSSKIEPTVHAYMLIGYLIEKALEKP